MGRNGRKEKQSNFNILLYFLLYGLQYFYNKFYRYVKFHIKSFSLKITLLWFDLDKLQSGNSWSQSHGWNIE